MPKTESETAMTPHIADSPGQQWQVRRIAAGASCCRLSIAAATCHGATLKGLRRPRLCSCTQQPWPQTWPQTWQAQQDTAIAADAAVQDLIVQHPMRTRQAIAASENLDKLYTRSTKPTTAMQHMSSALKVVA